MSIELNFRDNEIINRLGWINNILKNSSVSFDIDGVEVLSGQSVIDEVNKQKGTSYSIDDLKTHWGLIELFKSNHPEVKDPRGYAVELWNDPSVLGRSGPVQGTWLLAHYLHKQGIDNVVRISSRPNRVRDVTVKWYKEKMPWVDSSSIYIQPGEEIETGLSFKIETIKRLGVKLCFEDSVEHAVEIAKLGVTVVLVPQPWNLDYRTSNPKIITPKPKISVDDPIKMIKVYLGLFGRINNVAQCH